MPGQLSSILSKISGPEDIKRLDQRSLEVLAKEIRSVIVETVAKNGGHLGSNLGVVELTIALHMCFSSPRDKIVWDVGHQTYTHKLLTGRYRDFGSLRQRGGISGYPDPKESPYDAFIAGHASTAISASLGMACARDLKGESHHIVAVIGDGSLTGGMSFEAMNHAGQKGSRLIVALNDNGMFISHRVGALASYLNRIRTHPAYNKVRSDIEQMISRLPLVGENVSRSVDRLKDSLKHLVVPGMLFEELGFRYFGPVNGHDIPAIMRNLEAAKRHDGPTLIHILTQKGKGYQPAELEPSKFHGVGPFNSTTGTLSSSTKKPTYSEVFGHTMVRLGFLDSRLVAITAAMPDGTGLLEFSSKFPERCFDVGIAEQHAVTFASALASSRMRPVFAVYSTFLQRAYDQIVHDVALPNLGVVFAMDRAGIVGEDGPTHQGEFDLSYLGHVPNLTIMVPSSGSELRDMLYTAVILRNSPTAIRYPKCRTPEDYLPDGDFQEICLGKAQVLKEGDDLVIWALGSMVTEALGAASILEKQGIGATVVNGRFVRPVDEDLLYRLIDEIGVLLIVEENVTIGGAGSQILTILHDNPPPSGMPRVRCLGIPNRFIEHGKRDETLKDLGLSADGIARAAVELVTSHSSDEREGFLLFSPGEPGGLSTRRGTSR